mgnify:CR=1 FL=1
MACRKNSPGKPCCGPPDCESCCIGHIDFSIGGDGVDPLFTLSWDISSGSQPTTTLSTDMMPSGVTQQVCTRSYTAPIAYTLCSGTAKELPVVGMFNLLDRTLDLAGRYALATADYTGNLGMRSNVIVSSLRVSVLWSSGYVRVIAGGSSIQEVFTFPRTGATRRAYNTGTCLGTGGVTTYTDIDSAYCDSTTYLNACFAANPYLPGIIVNNYFSLGSYPSMDSGWLTAANCAASAGEYSGSTYALYHYNIGCFAFGPIPDTRTVTGTSGSCSENDFTQTFPSTFWETLRNKVTLAVCA